MIKGNRANGKINSLQGLRFIACAFVFCAHTAIDKLIPFFGGGGSGVMFFLVLSGFLESYNHLGDEQKNWNKKRINGLISMSFFSTFAAFILWLIMGYTLDWKTVVALVISLILLQSWFPSITYHYTLLSSVSWFIGDLLFCYLLTPFLMSMIKKFKKKQKALIFIVIGKFLLELIITVKIEGEMEHFFIYIFPPFRVLDYICGLLLGTLFIDKVQNDDCSSKASGTKELIAILLFMGVTVLSGNISVFQYGTLLLLPTLLLIYVFAFENGFYLVF